MMRILEGLFAPCAVKALGFSGMTRALWVAGAALLLIASVLAPRQARCESPPTRGGPLYVLSIWTDDADDQADALTQALRWRVGQTPGFALLQTSQSFETLAIALKCPARPDNACLQRIGDQLKADHYMWGTMDKKKAPSGEINVEVHLWTRGKPDTSTRESYADTLKDANDESLRAIATGIFTKLTGVIPPPAPAATPAPAPVASAPAAAPNTADGGLQALGVAVSPTAAPSAEEPESDKSATRTVLAYSALAVGVAAIVVSGVEVGNWVSDNNKSSDDRKQVPSTVIDVCATPVNLSAQDACNRSKDAVTSSTLAWVFGGVGVALVGTGIALIVTESNAPPEEKPRSQARLLPVIGPGVAGVDLRVRF
jgi:hypothetical protein